MNKAGSVTPRGFTGHEHFDAHGIINMNGRIYDPHLGRFLQADPFVEDTGTLNRYTYVHNNPLVFTDPSGYFSFKKWGRIVASIAISVYSGGSVQGASWGLWGSSVSSLQAVATVAVGGAVSGAISSGTWEGAYYGAFSSLAFYNVGQEISSAAWARGSGASGLSAAGLAAKTVSHGLIGGAVAHAQGGKFGHGFLSSGVTAASSPYIANGFDGNRFAQGALASMVGGTVSSATGGKFANGAVTAAMAFAFNQLQSPEGPNPCDGNCVTKKFVDEVAQLGRQVGEGFERLLGMAGDAYSELVFGTADGVLLGSVEDLVSERLGVDTDSIAFRTGQIVGIGGGAKGLGSVVKFGVTHPRLAGQRFAVVMEATAEAQGFGISGAAAAARMSELSRASQVLKPVSSFQRVLPPRTMVTRPIK